MKLFLSLLLLISFKLVASEAPILEFRPDKLEATKAWARNAEYSLKRLQLQSDRKAKEDVSEYMRRGIDKILADSRGQNESLIRFILSRSIVFHDLLLQDTEGAKRKAFERQFLEENIALAIEAYQVDLNLFERNVNISQQFRSIEFAKQSTAYAEYIFQFHYQISSNQSRLNWQLTNLLIWLNDIQRDVEFHRFLAPISHSLASIYIRYSELNPTNNLQTLSHSRRLRSELKTELSAAKERFYEYEVLNEKQENEQ